VYTIEAETYNNLKKFSRVFFGPDQKKRTNIVKRNIQVKIDGQMDCREEVVYVKENTRDIQSPIKLRLNYTIVEPPLPTSGLKSLNPILDQTQADRPFQASFQKDCGTDDICQSQLEVTAELMLEKKGECATYGNNLTIFYFQTLYFSLSLSPIRWLLQSVARAKRRDSSECKS
jgi:integrin alpha 7